MIYETLKIKIEGLLKILIMSKRPVIVAKKEAKNLFIFGNGPSLTKDLDQNSKAIAESDVIAVNYFAATDEFIKTKPNHYVIISKFYWERDKNEDWHQDRQRLFQNLVEKVDWKMNLFVPVLAKKAKKWIEFMSQNPNIQLNFFNLTPVDEFPSFFKRQLNGFKACPRPHNVLIPSVLIGINLEYENCYLIGSDHSWISEIFVTEDNVVMMAQKHFYSEQLKHLKSSLLLDKAKPVFDETDSLKTKKLHEILFKFYNSFKSYWFLKEYASLKRVKIYNLTEGSFIDAFDKISHDEITS